MDAIVALAAWLPLAGVILALCLEPQESLDNR